MATQHATFVSTEEMLADASAQEGLPARVGRVLDKTVARNDEAAQRGSQDAACRSAFECHSPCPLLPSRYVERIMKYTQCSPCTLVVAIVYLQRLKDQEASGPSAAGAGCQPLRLTSFNIQRMFLTAMMIAHKFLDEPVCSNKQWSLVGDLTVKEMNSLELHMLWTLQFDCNVSRAEYDACQAALGALDASLPEHRAPALALQPRAPCTASSIAISA